MSTTLLWPVEEAQFNTPVRVGPPPRNRYAMDSYSSLATFHMPRTVEVTVRSDDVCVFEFSYPNEEPPERSWRAYGDTRTEFRLGKHSRKILAVRIKNARECLLRGPLLLAPQDPMPWVRDAAAHSSFAAQRNAEVVLAILAAMPDNVRAELVRDLDQITAEHPAQA